jgi:hypothetical protein
VSILPITPNPLRIEDALAQSAPLELLQRRLRESKARFDTIKHLFPTALAPHVLPGPVDALGWSLLADNNAVAAKLRHLKPDLEAALQQRGWQVSAIRIKVHSQE